MIESAKRQPGDTVIAVVMDGRTLFVPDDPSNRDRRRLEEWEKAGGVVAPADPEPAPVTDPRDAEIADLKAAVAALKKRGVLTDAMIDAERPKPARRA